jgi:hypothetical protein
LGYLDARIADGQAMLEAQRQRQTTEATATAKANAAQDDRSFCESKPLPIQILLTIF